MPTLSDYVDAVTASDLGPLDRWLLTVHAMRADPATLQIRAADQLSLTDQADMTGAHRSTITRHLNRLEGAGWLTRDRPSKRDQRRYHARTAYTLTVPGASCTQQPPLGADGGRLGADPGRPRRGLRRGLDALRGARTDRQIDPAHTPNPWDDAALVALAHAQLSAEFPGRDVTRDQATAAVRLITEGRTIRTSAAAYIRKSIRDNPRRFMPAAIPPPVAVRPAGGMEPARLSELTAETRRNLATRGRLCSGRNTPATPTGSVKRTA